MTTPAPAPAPFEIAVAQAALDDLGERLRRTREEPELLIEDIRAFFRDLR